LIKIEIIYIISLLGDVKLGFKQNQLLSSPVAICDKIIPVTGSGGP
jgi:hypothetical protein